MESKMKLQEAWRSGPGWKGAKAKMPGRQRIHQKWMADFATEYEKLGGFPGNIDWDTAQNMKDKGIKPKDAAKRMKMLY